MDYSYSRQFNDRRNSYSQNSRGRSCGCSQPQTRVTRSTPDLMPQKESCMGPCLDSLPLGMAYVPLQKFENLYSAEEGLHAGTIFKDLNYPFIVGICGKGCGCK